MGIINNIIRESNIQPEISCNKIISTLLMYIKFIYNRLLSQEIYPYIENPSIYSDKIKNWGNDIYKSNNIKVNPQSDKTIIIYQYIIIIGQLFNIIYKLNNKISKEIYEFIKLLPSLIIESNTPTVYYYY